MPVGFKRLFKKISNRSFSFGKPVHLCSAVLIVAGWLSQQARLRARAPRNLHSIPEAIRDFRHRYRFSTNLRPTKMHTKREPVLNVFGVGYKSCLSLYMLKQWRWATAGITRNTVGCSVNQYFMFQILD